MHLPIEKRRAFINRWGNMLDRCDNEENPSFHRYGGRGIKVCDRWYDFWQFVEDLPEGYFDKADLDRIDNNKGYEPGNVRWVTRAQNCKNRKGNRNITFNGETLCISDWARRVGVNVTTLMERLDKWSVEDALTQPKGTRLYNRWDGHKKQPAKEKKKMRTYEYMGAHYTMTQLAAMAGIMPKLMRKRINERGWDVARAVETPLDK